MQSLKKKKVLLLMGICMVVLISVAAFIITEERVIAQNKAVIGKMYQEDPEACEMMVKELFESSATKENQEAGEQALLKLGYTKQGAEYLYQGIGLFHLHMIAILLQILVICGICAVFYSLEKIRNKEEEQLISDIWKDINQKKQLQVAQYKIINKSFLFEISRLLSLLHAKEKELQQERQNKQRFVENIAHQIKTPLACISISMDMLSEELNNRQKEYVNQTFRYLKEIEILMKRILDIGRLESGKLLMKKEAIQLDVLLQECIMLLNPEREKIILETEKNAFMQPYYGDYDWLKEAFSNILKNCMEHDKSEKPVQIKLVQKKEQIFIQIRDHGPGIAEEDLKHIFDRFYLPKDAKKSHTGIGLNLADLVIKKHFGMVEVHNHETGGAVFSILLPIYGFKEEKLSFS